MNNPYVTTQDLEYLLDFQAKYPDVLRDFIRNQLISSAKESISSLEYMRSLLPAESMNQMIQGLNETERLSWKAHVGREKTITEPAKLMNYIKGELTKAFVASKPLVDPELMELTLKLKVHDVVRFSEMYQNEAGELLNLLNPTFISKVLDKVDVKAAERFLQAALESRVGSESSLKSNLKKFLSSSQKNSMPSKLLKVLETVEPEKEKMIYSQLLKVSSTEELMVTATRNCPLDVVWLLPKSALNEVLQAYPLNKKARLLASLDGEKKELLLAASSAEGSSARQMIDMELKQIEENAQELRRCQSQVALMTGEFLKFLRLHSQGSDQLMSDVKMACMVWFSQITESPAQTRQAA